MLILNFIEEKKKIRFLKRKGFPFKTGGFICNNTVFNVIELYKSNLDNDDVITLLNRYKGFVLETADENINKMLSRYLFDCIPYVKRAYLSGLVTFLSVQKQPSVIVEDNEFRFSSEWLKIASLCKQIVLTGAENNDMYLFRDYCFRELGLNVFINDKRIDGVFFTVNLNYIKKNEPLYVQGSGGGKIFPDSKYFMPDDFANKLISYGVSPYMACAAVQVVPFKKGYVKPV